MTLTALRAKYPGYIITRAANELMLAMIFLVKEGQYRMEQHPPAGSVEAEVFRCMNDITENWADCRSILKRCL